MLQPYLILFLRIFDEDWIWRIANKDYSSSLCVQCVGFQIQSWNFKMFYVVMWQLGAYTAVITWPKGLDCLHWAQWHGYSYCQRAEKGKIEDEEATTLYLSEKPTAQRAAAMGISWKLPRLRTATWNTTQRDVTYPRNIFNAIMRNSHTALCCLSSFSKVVKPAYDAAQLTSQSLSAISTPTAQVHPIYVYRAKQFFF